MLQKRAPLYIAIASVLILAGCGEPVHDADWYHEHDQARHDKLEQCTESTYNQDHIKDCSAAKDAASKISMEELENDTGGDGTNGHDFTPQSYDKQ